MNRIRLKWEIERMLMFPFACRVEHQIRKQVRDLVDDLVEDEVGLVWEEVMDHIESDQKTD